MRIRELQLHETAFLEEMLFHALFVPEGAKPFPPSIIYEPDIHKYIKDWGKTENDIAFVAEQNNKLIGVIWGRLFKESDMNYGFIDEAIPEIGMAVLAPYRNKGIGTRLIETIIRCYQNRGIKALSLSVSKQNEARKLYERAGFRVASENKSDFVMIKDIG
ncbi:GNAT family N-acetyltransferase [Dysgonomonas sp. ZJ709]|uniref:GNAT family N-acetyltransferase n=1 Tax=Dysgonomonas sp. ZJ709 TaxID=2709797 RepID=UPI0013E9D01C|nr:GNAT family N-acetyltransferase [Dysgonomonas sp. ZJ709]